jgi:hypothetical protein
MGFLVPGMEGHGVERKELQNTGGIFLQFSFLGAYAIAQLSSILPWLILFGHHHWHHRLFFHSVAHYTRLVLPNPVDASGT